MKYTDDCHRASYSQWLSPWNIPPWQQLMLWFLHILHIYASVCALALWKRITCIYALKWLQNESHVRSSTSLAAVLEVMCAVWGRRGQNCYVWVSDCGGGTFYNSLLNLILSSSSLSPPLSTYMPHYILKVNSINTKIIKQNPRGCFSVSLPDIFAWWLQFGKMPYCRQQEPCSWLHYSFAGNGPQIIAFFFLKEIMPDDTRRNER